MIGRPVRHVGWPRDAALSADALDAFFGALDASLVEIWRVFRLKGVCGCLERIHTREYAVEGVVGGAGRLAEWDKSGHATDGDKSTFWCNVLNVSLPVHRVPEIGRAHV